VTHRVGIVIVTHNSARHIADLLDSIPSAIGDVDARIVVVDSGSSDDTANIVRTWPDTKLVTTNNVGYGAAINLGAATLSNVTALLVLNPDLRLSLNSVPTLLDELVDPQVGIVVPKLTDEHGTLSYSLRNDPTVARALGLGWLKRTTFSETITDRDRYDSPFFVDWATGAAMLIRRNCFDNLGGWDPSYFLYSEETDFCIRARNQGWRIRFTPAAIAAHIGGGSGRNDTLHGMQLVNRVRLYGRQHARTAAYVYWAVCVLAELSWLARGRSKSAQALSMLVIPSRRPTELGASETLIPR
jgi:GT2 family glycosyltransferase